MRLKSKIAVSAAVTALLLVAFATPATAAEVADQLPSSATAVVYAPDCVAKVSAADREQCKLTTTMSLSQERDVSIAEIQADTTLSASDKESLLAAAGIMAISSKNYSQFTTGGLYTVTHGGKFYYNGTRAWVGTSYSGYTGSHKCVINYTTVVITVNSCSESGSTYEREMYMQWTVFAPGIAYGVDMEVYLRGNGTAAGFGHTLS